MMDEDHIDKKFNVGEDYWNDIERINHDDDDNDDDDDADDDDNDDGTWKSKPISAHGCLWHKCREPASTPFITYHILLFMMNDDDAE